jgi:mannose-6-phosphate isomerase-like protein (cupin superfamily)
MTIVEKPWGNYEVLSQDASHWHKRITVKLGHRLSLQTHEDRDEFWIVESGRGSVRIGDRSADASAGKTFFIPRGTKHRITNWYHTPLVFTEIAMGNVSEDDIIRIEDDYGRA